MTIEELKDKINDSQKIIDDKPLVFKYQDNKFLSCEYANAIAKKRNLEKLYISSLSEMQNSDDMFDTEPAFLYIYDVEKLNEDINSDTKNIIVICKSVPDNLSIDYIDMTKISNWQVEAYAQERLKGLNSDQIKWLCEICKYDVFRIDSECKKLELFAPNMQKIMFDEFNKDNAYADLNPMTIFNFTDAIMVRNYQLVGDLIPEIGVCDLEPLGVVTTLLKKFIQILNVQYNPGATASSLGMSDKQFGYLRTHPNMYYSKEQIIDNIEFLTGVDAQVKSGNLDLTREELLSYFVTKVLAM